MSNAYECEVCCGTPDWRIDREGDAVVTWACDRHMGNILLFLQRPFERTRLIVTVSPRP